MTNKYTIISQIITTATCFDNIVSSFAGGKIEKNEMGGACGAYGGGERCAQGFGGEA